MHFTVISNHSLNTLITRHCGHSFLPRLSHLQRGDRRKWNGVALVPAHEEINTVTNCNKFRLFLWRIIYTYCRIGLKIQWILCRRMNGLLILLYCHYSVLRITDSKTYLGRNVKSSFPYFHFNFIGTIKERNLKKRWQCHFPQLSN
jgi:hypothetical protein